jgi:putative FmdB family regulatory protein
VPLYEYECPECGCRLEQRRSMADSDRPDKCPQCGKGVLKRVLSLFSTASSSDSSCAPSGAS